MVTHHPSSLVCCGAMDKDPPFPRDMHLALSQNLSSAVESAISTTSVNGKCVNQAKDQHIFIEMEYCFLLSLILVREEAKEY